MENKVIIESGLNKKRHKSRTKKYKVLKTDKISKIFFKNGFNLVNQFEGGFKKLENKGYQRHCLVFENEKFKLGDDKIQLCLYNDHLGRGCLVLNFKILVLVCSNGLKARKSFFEIKVPHRGNNIEKRLNNAIKDMILKVGDLTELVNKLKNFNPTSEQIDKILKNTVNYRFKGVENLTYVNYKDLTVARWEAQKENNAWNLLNRVQESVIKGGINFQTIKDGKIKNQTTRRVKSLTKDYNLNTFVFDQFSQLVS